MVQPACRHPPDPDQGKVMFLHWWRYAGLGDVTLLLMLLRQHPNRCCLWALEMGV